MSFTLPPLPYPYDALEPYIDAKTMEIHYTKHHQGYVDNLNKALADYPQLQNKTLKELLEQPTLLPEAIQTAVRNNGGGHMNHSLFWQLMKKQGGGEPRGSVGDNIKKTFGNFERFKELFSQAAKARFGSGWAWLCLNKERKLMIISTPNQDSTFTDKLIPLLGIDVWEHAYYLG